MTITVDLSADDFAQSPWNYPGAAPPYGGLLDEGLYRRLYPKAGRRLGEAYAECSDDEVLGSLDDALLSSNAAGVDNRYLVVAVGSNASPAVVWRKFNRADVSTTVPFISATARGLAVGHSAHVSLPGFVAATPLHIPSACTRVFASLLDRDQLECLDATEPNYLRRSVNSDKCLLDFESGERPSSFLVYTSRWGALAPPGGAPVLLGSQAAVFERLLGTFPEFAALADKGPPFRAFMRTLAEDGKLRDAARKAIKKSGWTARFGFEDCPEASKPIRYGLLESQLRNAIPHLAGEEDRVQPLPAQWETAPPEASA